MWYLPSKPILVIFIRPMVNNIFTHRQFWFHNQWQKKLVHEVDCRRIIEGDELEIAYALDVLQNGDYICSSNDDVRNNAQNCELFLKTLTIIDSQYLKRK